MIKIAIVEDDDNEAQILTQHLQRYLNENGEAYECKRYSDAFSFLESKQAYDLAFLDIMLPGMTGMEAATKIREHNSKLCIIFVTNMMNFAVKSYEVDALDYILKPISYERVVFKLKKAIQLIKESESATISIYNNGNMVHISVEDLFYVEVRGHKLTYVTAHGNFVENGTLKKVEENLARYHFAKCNSCYLVHLSKVFSVNGVSVIMANGDELKISQPKRKEFIDCLTNYLGQNK